MVWLDLPNFLVVANYLECTGHDNARLATTSVSMSTRPHYSKTANRDSAKVVEKSQSSLQRPSNLLSIFKRKCLFYPVRLWYNES